MGRPSSSKPRSTILGSGSRPAPKPSAKSSSSDWRDQLPSDDEGDIKYEPLDDDDALYLDDDDIEYFDDDGDEFYDDDV